MRIGDWSSDVCSSDLEGGLAVNRCDVWDLWKGHHHFERDVELFRRFGVGRKAVGERIDSELGCRIFALARFGLNKFHEIEARRSEEHTSELQSLMRISYAVFCLKKKKSNAQTYRTNLVNTYKPNIPSIHSEINLHQS